MIRDEDEIFIGEVELENGADVQMVVREDVVEMIIDCLDLSVSLVLTKEEARDICQLLVKAAMLV